MTATGVDIKHSEQLLNRPFSNHDDLALLASKIKKNSLKSPLHKQILINGQEVQVLGFVVGARFKSSL